MKNKEKENRGITLVALIITVILMLILAGVAISSIIDGEGLFGKTRSASKLYENASRNEALIINHLLSVLPNEINNLSINVENEDIYYTGKKLEFSCKDGIKSAKLNGKSINTGEVINEVGTYILELEDNKGNKAEYKFYVNDGLVALIKDKELESGVQVVTVNNVDYNINLIEVDGDLILDGIMTNEYTTLTTSTKTYEVGVATDVATDTVDAQNTVILKVKGNLTINEGVTLTAVKSASGYGGPKGMYICVDGILTNNGEISMTARGARAEGQDVYLWQNADGSYENIPAIGSAGGRDDTLYRANEYLSSYDKYRKALDGVPGSSVIEGRALAGGGSGGLIIEGRVSGVVRAYIGNGSDATSYSGGSGGGGMVQIRDGVTSATTYTAASAAANGGAGGRGKAYDGMADWHRYAGGGAGNPGGAGYYESTAKTAINGDNGTGGLLIIFGQKVINNGTISSNGSNSNSMTISGNTGRRGGGASGAGSVNVFYVKDVEEGNIQVEGGTATWNGGNGGNGSKNVGKIIDGTYIQQK